MGATLGKKKSPVIAAEINDVKVAINHKTTTNGADAVTITTGSSKKDAKKSVSKIKGTISKSKILSTSRDTKGTMNEPPTIEIVKFNAPNYGQSAVANAHGIFLSTNNIFQLNDEMAQVNNAFVSDNPVIENCVQTLITPHYELVTEQHDSVAPEILQLRQAYANFKFGDSIDQVEPTSPVIQAVSVEHNQVCHQSSIDEINSSLPSLPMNEVINNDEQQVDQYQQQQLN
ncbi:unnamed protein product [Didymodactylos carnosus]|uniref:Uncharacterized protein n=1 Tax=Didymodactylos carnosus TaxID=1234261 RepID=A0A813UPE4_9BILA|nr:unnamed protein product [Didymodactylos carnosus]CAF3619192.1 unnamed protein product [Didymodactylos carnosus]